MFIFDAKNTQMYNENGYKADSVRMNQDKNNKEVHLHVKEYAGSIRVWLEG